MLPHEASLGFALADSASLRQVEHGTIPLYLTALYSIQDAGAWYANLIPGISDSNSGGVQCDGVLTWPPNRHANLIRGVAIEE